MNSKQLNFYSHPNEISKFLDFLLLKGAKVSVEPFTSREFELYENANFTKFDNIFHRIILFKNGESNENITIKYINTQKYYLFEHLDSNIIQFDFPTIRNNKFLYRGRFYFATGYWKEDEFVKKDPEFIKWATNLMQNFKKQFLIYKEPKHSEYCTEYIKKMVDSNEIELRQI